MKKETKFVTVYWSEIVRMRNTIEVDKDEKDEEYMLQEAIEYEPKVYGCEVETDSIEVVIDEK